MPKPGKKEKKKDFIERCIPMVMQEGTAKDSDQAVAICNSMWDEHEKEKKSAPEENSHMKVERRTLQSEIRSSEADGRPVLEGYAAKFGVLSQDLGGFLEKIEKNAFADSVKSSDIRALHNHDANLILGRTSAKTLEVSEDDTGLKVKIYPPDTQWARDLVTSIKRGDISQMSFGFRCQEDKWETKDEQNVRTLLRAELMDVSSVTFPAYLDTSIQARGISMADDTLDALRRIMVRFEHKLTLSDGDKAEIRRITGMLGEMVKDEIIPKPEEKQSTEEILRALALRQHQLNLRNRTI